MKQTLPHKTFFIMGLSIFICCIHGSPAEYNVTVLQKLATASNEFSMKIHRALSQNYGDNIFFSPTSLFLVLGMLYKGAGGETARELRNLLGFNEAGLTEEDIDDSFPQLLREYSSAKNYTLKTASVVLADHRITLNRNYSQVLNNTFHTNIRFVDFHKDTRSVVEDMNRWIKDQTNGEISHFLDNLDRSTVMTILNAIYFKGLWSIPFEKGDNKREPFYSYGGNGRAKPKYVLMMHKSHRMPYTSSDDWEMVELPYKGDRISMLVVLPKQRDGLAAVESTLTSSQISEYRNKMRMATVNLTLPKFRIDSVLQHFDQTLKSLNAGKMFQQNEADFSKMSDTRVHVSQVMHKAVVTVDEGGTGAAAATGVYLVPLSLSVPRVFRMDHPFFFVIIDKKTNLILFSGRVIRL